jgi:hypothetical protein
LIDSELWRMNRRLLEAAFPLLIARVEFLDGTYQLFRREVS